MPSIVDPAEVRGGGWTVTRGLIKAIGTAFPHSEIECIADSARGRVAHGIRQLIGISRSALGDELPAKALFTRTTKFRRQLDAALANAPPDLVLINGSDLFWVLDRLPRDLPVVVAAQNIEQELYARQVTRASRHWLPIGRLFASDLGKLRKYEWEGMRKAGRMIFFSEDDRAMAMRACPDIDSITVPPMFDYEPVPHIPLARDRIRIGMFADFTWWPNRASLDWFLSRVWRSVSSDVELHLIGYGSENAANGEARIVAHGTVEHARDAFAICDLMIAPIVDGAGVKVKVAEALYNRVPIVATQFAVRGLPQQARTATRICDSSGEWIEFLNGTAPRDVASRPVPAEVAALFSTSRVSDLLRDFLAGSSSRLIA